MKCSVGYVFAIAALSVVGCGDVTKTAPVGLDYGPEGAVLAAKDDSASSQLLTLSHAKLEEGTLTRTKRWVGYRFDGQAAERIQIRLEGLATLDTVVFLYRIGRNNRPYGWPIAANDDTAERWSLDPDRGPNPLSSSIEELVLPADGAYAVIVTSYRQRGIGRYVLRLRRLYRRCGGIAGWTCPAGMICDITTPDACGGADLSGTCIVQPEVCTKEYFPVCGCDGVTYGNDCMRQSAGAQLDHAGECAGQQGASCGGRGQAGCADGLYCNFDSSCGSDDGGGTCAEKPTLCTRDYRPVCGCDGSTYSNECEAAAAGVSVRAQQACPGKEGEACGSWFLPFQCEEGLYCKFGPDCGWADRPGVCTKKATGCTREWAPVCGCDGQTYSNECVAAATGVAVQYEGQCKAREGEPCGGRGLPGCEQGLYCKFGADCGATDLPGVCESQPTICTREYAPVCGCDRQTYGNACSAASQGVSVVSEGECR